MSKTATAETEIIHRSLTSLAASVDIARRRVDGGDMVELRDLDRAVAESATRSAICRSISGPA